MSFFKRMFGDGKKPTPPKAPQPKPNSLPPSPARSENPVASASGVALKAHSSSATASRGVASDKNLASLLKDEMPDEPKVEALLAFLAMGESAVDLLLTRARSSEDRFERYAAVEVIGFLGYPSSFEPLHAMFGSIDDHWLLCHWSRALGCLADRRAIERLIPLCDALGVIPYNPSRPLMPSNAAAMNALKHGALGDSIANSLGIIGDGRAISALVPLLDDDDFSLRRAAAEALVELGEKGIDALISVVRDPEKPEALRGSPIRALGTSNDSRVLTPLLDLFQENDCRLRDSAIDALAELMASAATGPSLGEAIDGIPPEIRRDLDAALTKRKDGRSFDVLMREVSGNENPYAGASAAAALGELGDKRAFDAIVQLLSNDADVLRTAGAKALRQMPDPRAIAPLARLLKDNKKEVRREAAVSLGYMGDARAMETMLLDLLPSILKANRLAAIAGMGRLADVRAVEPLTRCLRWAYGPERRAIYVALERMGEPGVERLLVELNDSRPLVRSRSLAALGTIGNASILETVTKLKSDGDPEVKAAATTAVEDLGAKTGLLQASAPVSPREDDSLSPDAQSPALELPAALVDEVVFLGGSSAADADKPATPKSTSPTNTPEQAALDSALEAAGYNKPMKLPTDQDSIVDSLTQTMLARQSCQDENLFETGEKNPQRILCSDNNCPCTDQKPLIIGKTAYLYISQQVIDFRKTCLTLLEREIQLQEYGKRMGVGVLMIDGGVANPFYLCEIGARKRGLDLSVALADAKRVAETGFAPLRPTPKHPPSTND